MDGSNMWDEKRKMWEGCLTMEQAKNFLEFTANWALSIQFSSLGTNEYEKPTTTTEEILKACVKYMLEAEEENWTNLGIKTLKLQYKNLFKEEYNKNNLEEQN